MYQLKKGQEAFTVVEGTCKGMVFLPGLHYAQIPQGDAGKFTAVKEAEPPVDDAAKPKTKEKSA